MTGGQAGLKYSTCLLLVNQSSPKKSRTTHTLKSYRFLLLNTSIHQLPGACFQGRVQFTVTVLGSSWSSSKRQ